MKIMLRGVSVNTILTKSVFSYTDIDLSIETFFFEDFHLHKNVAGPSLRLVYGYPNAACYLIQENILKGKNTLSHGMLQFETHQNQMHNYKSFSYFLALLLTEKQWCSCAVFWTLYHGFLKKRQENFCLSTVALTQKTSGYQRLEVEVKSA